MNINQYAVYQLKESAELAAYRSRSYQYLTEHHFQVIVQIISRRILPSCLHRTHQR